MVKYCTKLVFGSRRRHGVDFAFDFFEEIVVIFVLSDHHHKRTPFHSHGCAQILSRRRVDVRKVLLLANGRQMAHDLDGSHVAGEDHEAFFAFADSRLNVLEAVADHSLVLDALLDALVDLFGQLLGGHRLGDDRNMPQPLVVRNFILNDGRVLILRHLGRFEP